VIGVNMDITARKTAEEALERSRNDQMKFKDDFLSHVSHELRSPLTAIKQFTTILIGGLAGALTPEQLQYQQIVLKNIHQLQAMIDDLLEVTRLETGKLTLELEQVSIQDVVADAVNTLRGSADAKAIEITTRFALGLPPAHADPTRLRQILIILLDNAVKFTQAGGSVEISAALADEPGTLRLQVSDTGCGISPEIRSRIFERLYQVSSSVASRKGLGLGLFICHELVTRHGGRIDVATGAEKGTAVSFTVPVFSLNILVASLLKSNRWPAASGALVTVDFEFAGVLHRPPPDITLEVRAFLQRCLLPDLDILLPECGPGPHGVRFFVAVFADEHGVSVLCNRIREQFTGHRLLTERQVNVSVAFTMLPPFAQDVGTPSETAVESMALMLDQAIASTPAHSETP
jgi:nitrogen-specific signal transduction histidine kinase